jgi:S1-C subfamily serine protease
MTSAFRKSLEFRAAACGATAFLLASWSGAATPPTRRNEVVAVVEKVSPAVVNISAEQTVRRQPSIFDQFFGEPGASPRRYKTKESSSTATA